MGCALNTGRTPSTLWSGSAGSTPCVSTAFLVLSAASTMVAPLCVSSFALMDMPFVSSWPSTTV